MPSRCRHVLLAAFLLLGMLGTPFCVQAANALNSLNLVPKSTLIAILDKEGKLTSRLNQRLFEAAGFHVEILNACNGKDEFICVRSNLEELKKTREGLALLFMTSGLHSKTVYSLYSEMKLNEFLSAVVMFRAEYPFKVDPPQTDRIAPPLLVIAKAGDAAAVVLATRRFSDRMRRLGVWSWFFLMPDQMSRIFRPGDHDVIIKIIYQFIGYRFAGASKDDALFYQYLTENARWQKPPLNNDGFYGHPEFIATYRTTDHFMKAMKVRFRDEPHRLKQWKFETFKGFDILAYRDSNEATRNARYMVLRNLSGSFFPLDLDVFEKHKPLIVVGIDDESNLFRIYPFLYQSKAKYSWLKEGRPEISVRPLGAFLHFQNPVPKKLKPIINLISNLKFDSISFKNEDPLAGLDGVSSSLKAVFTLANGGCVFCHKVKGIGGRMHHLVSATARPQPGYALPLRSYPEEVMHRFLYDQEQVAALFGVTPNFVSSEQARELTEFLTEAR